MYFDETECMYFIMEEEEAFGKCMEVWEKVSYIIKRLIVNLYIVKNI